VAARKRRGSREKNWRGRSSKVCRSTIGEREGWGGEEEDKEEEEEEEEEEAQRRRRQGRRRKEEEEEFNFFDNPESSVRIDVILELTFSYCVRWLFIVLTNFYSCSLKV